MIFSLFLRNFKTYRSTNYIPITNGTFFSAMVGPNGIGKSSVLEALDCYFNNKEWNLNHSLNKGFSEREPFICPVFLIEKRKINSQRNMYKYLEVVSDIVWQLEKEDFVSAWVAMANEFCLHRDEFVENNKIENYFIFPHGLIKRSKTSQDFSSSIFEGIDDFEVRLLDECNVKYEDYVKELEVFVNDFYSYIYLPSEIDFQAYTKIEGDTVQALMGAKIEDIVKERINEQHIRDINSNLSSFMEGVASNLENYEYKKPGLRQNLFNQSHLASKVIEIYFASKVLNFKNEQEELTPVYNLSSGEKRKALIDIARAFLLNSENETKKQVILGIDEPEISLHVSSCFSQFEKIKDISSKNIQTLLTTHWYGFMPIVTNGSAIYMSGAKQSNHLLDLQRFRDDIKELKVSSKGSLPSNVELKSINDLVQSVIASVMGDDYRWIICEGVSDKIYLEYFLSGAKKINVLPLGGAPVVKKFFTYVTLALRDERSSVKGKIFFLIDTDQEYEYYEASDISNVVCMRRLLNSPSDKKTLLLNVKDKNVSPPTVIEDVLDAKIFDQTLKFFSKGISDSRVSSLLSGMQLSDDNLPSGLAYDWRDSEKLVVNEFFSIPTMKVKFAKKYVEFNSAHGESIPSWFDDIRSFLE